MKWDILKDVSKAGGWGPYTWWTSTQMSYTWRTALRAYSWCSTWDARPPPSPKTKWPQSTDQCISLQNKKKRVRTMQKWAPTQIFAFTWQNTRCWSQQYDWRLVSLGKHLPIVKVEAKNTLFPLIQLHTCFRHAVSLLLAQGSQESTQMF